MAKSNFYTNVAHEHGKILVRGYKDGQRFVSEVPYRPYLFLPSPTPSKFKTISGKYVKKVDFESTYELFEFTKKYKDVVNYDYYGMTMPIYTFINDNTPGDIKYDESLISKVIIDIETESKNGFPIVETANKAILSIALRKNKKNIVLGLRDYIPRPDTEFIKCVDEKELLSVFLTVWNDLDIDVVTGWNTSIFDIPYLYNRITKILSEKHAKRLSPWGIVKPRSFSVGFGRKLNELELVGIASLDYLYIYIKFAYTPQESHKLDHISQTELGHKKTDYSEFKSMSDFYENDYQKFIDYNINDCVLVDELEEKKGLMSMMYAMAYDSKTNFRDCFTPTKTWDVIIHNHLFKQGIVVPAMKKREKASIEGAYVKEPIIGLHKWVVSLDLDSLYPHLMMQYNISPETIRERVPGITVDDILDGELFNLDVYDRNVTVAATGDVYDKSVEGFFPCLMKQMYDGRIIWKKRMLDAKKKYEATKDPALKNEIDRCNNMQHQLKITLNSGYGSFVNEFFRWYDPRLGESITKSGQVAIRWTERELNTFLNEEIGTVDYDYVIAMDTDSVYLRLENLVNKEGLSNVNKTVDFLDAFAKNKLAPKIEQLFKDLFEYTHGYSNSMRMKRETIAEKGIWTGKKHYMLNAWDIEGVRYKTPELKITGIESVKSSTPIAFRILIKEAISIIMNGTQQDLVKFISQKRDVLKDIPLDELAFPRGVNDLTKYRSSSIIYIKGTPIGVKAALLYNDLLIKMNLTEEYELVHDHDKIKYLYLKLPNITKDKVIGFVRALPTEFNIDNCVDYKTQFDKGFLKPVENITKIIGWDIEERTSMDVFFE